MNQFWKYKLMANVVLWLNESPGVSSVVARQRQLCGPKVSFPMKVLPVWSVGKKQEKKKKPPEAAVCASRYLVVPAETSQDASRARARVLARKPHALNLETTTTTTTTRQRQHVSSVPQTNCFAGAVDSYSDSVLRLPAGRSLVMPPGSQRASVHIHAPPLGGVVFAWWLIKCIYFFRGKPVNGTTRFGAREWRFKGKHEQLVTASSQWSLTDFFFLPEVWWAAFLQTPHRCNHFIVV